jgi:hypothetical protein
MLAIANYTPKRRKIDITISRYHLQDREEEGGGLLGERNQEESKPKSANMDIQDDKKLRIHNYPLRNPRAREHHRA